MQQGQYQDDSVIWRTYFSQVECNEDDRKVMLFKELSYFFCTDQGWQFLSRVKHDRSGQLYALPLDYERLRTR